MLSIQPKFTNSAVAKVSFKSDNSEYIVDENKYNEKKSYYETRKTDFEESLEDKYIPGRFKKVLRGGVAISEGVLEGWAVTWALIKSAEFLKDGFNKIKNSKLTKDMKEVFAPVKKGFKQAGANIRNVFSKGVNNFKTSKFSTNFINWVEKLDKNKAGHILVKSVEFVGKTFKKSGEWISKAAKSVLKPLKKMTYTKTANVAAVTLGIGCGVMGTYNALKAYAKRDAAKNAELDNKSSDVKDKTIEKVEKDYAQEVEELNEEMAGEE